MRLSIVIPTYNRSKRLDKALADLLVEIRVCSATNKKNISVYVSNNGSTDDTVDVISKWEKEFSGDGVLISFNSFSSNLGFDANVLACYAGCDGDYCWFLSDDDNICASAIDMIFEDIYKYSPSVIYYNFDQKPYDKESPYICIEEYYGYVDEYNLNAVKKIIDWPKLSAVVVKRCASGYKVLQADSGFAHAMLALQCALLEGGVLHSPKFIAYPDDDYMDHIDFAPWIGNNVAAHLRSVLEMLFHYHSWQHFHF